MLDRVSWVEALAETQQIRVAYVGFCATLANILYIFYLCSHSYYRQSITSFVDVFSVPPENQVVF